MSTHLPKPKSYIKDSNHLKDLSNKINIPNNFKLISLDVSSLFTNIPRELVIAAIEKRFHFIEPHCKIPKHEFINCVKLLMESTCFQMQNVYYEQTYGTPMGSPISPVIADIVMQDLEEFCLNNLNFRLPFFIRYVDDILTMIPINKLDEILKVFNSYHNRLQFTSEVEQDGTINFFGIKNNKKWQQLPI